MAEVAKEETRGTLYSELSPMAKEAKEELLKRGKKCGMYATRPATPRGVFLQASRLKSLAWDKRLHR